MFETAGAPTITEPVYFLVGLLLLPIVAAIAAAFTRGKVAVGVAGAASLGLLVLSLFVAGRVAMLPPGHVLSQHVAQIVRVGQLDLALDLDASGASATFVVLVALVGLASTLHAAWTGRPADILLGDRLSSQSLLPPVSSRGSLPNPDSSGGLAPPSSSSGRLPAVSRPSLDEIEPEAFVDDAAAADDLAARIAWTSLLTASAILVALADAWPVIVTGLASSTVASWGLARASSGRGLYAAIAGDAAILFGAAVLFWALGGAFTTSGYTPDAQPRFALVTATNASAPEGRATVALTTYAGAQVVADDGPPLPGEPIRAPMSVTLDPGIVSIRILSGAASQDALVSHVTIAAGKAYVLLPFGPTVSLRNLADQLAVPRPNVVAQAAAVPLRATLATRTILGLNASLVIAIVVLVGLLLRLALVAQRREGPDASAVALEMLPTAVLALRLAPLLVPGSSGAMSFAAVAAGLGAVLAAWASTAADPRAGVRGVGAAAVAIAIAAALVGDPGGAFVVIAAASIGCAGALVAIDSGGDVRWLGVACAAIAGILPAAGSSSGFAGAVASAFSVAATGQIGAVVAAVLLLVAMMLLSLGALSVYDACIRSAPPRTASRPARTLAGALAAIALAGGVALGVGTSPFGGRAAPLARKLVPGGLAFDGAPRVAGAALAAAVVAAALGVLAARLVGGARRAATAGGALSAPARGLAGAGAFVGRAASFLGRSVLTLDREVVDDFADIVATGVDRVASLVRREEPRTSERIRLAILLAMVALLALVVLSSLVLG